MLAAYGGLSQGCGVGRLVQEHSENLLDSDGPWAGRLWDYPGKRALEY